MIDPIKKFVDENRAAFDHVEPPANMLQQIKNRLKSEEAEKQKVKLLFSKSAWMVAASVLLAITTIYFLYNKQDNGLDKMAHRQTPKATNKALAESNTNPQKEQGKKEQDKPVVQLVKEARVHHHRESLRKPGVAPVPVNELAKDLYARLGDSSSSSIRLLAILEIDKTNRINESTLDNLAKTMNNDSNSNVRLAALNLISRYAYDKHASALLVQSLSTQDDPLVQLGLISLLGNVKNTKIDERLFAIVDDPNTFIAVKDEAYVFLLKQNKL